MVDETLNQEFEDEKLEQVSGGYYEMTGSTNPNNCRCDQVDPAHRCDRCEHFFWWYWTRNPDHKVWDCRLGRKPYEV